jgi:hypothetical protein
MSSDLSSEIVSLCQKASCEQDSRKLLELTKQINHLLEVVEQKKHSQGTPADGQSGKAKSA